MSHTERRTTAVGTARRGTGVRPTVQRLRGRVGHGDDAGFTLVETIVSFTIFAIVSAAAVLALVTGIDTNNNTSDRVAAAQLAQQVTDRARAMPKPLLTATPTQITTESVGNKSYTVTRTVSTSSGGCLAPAATPTAGDETVRKIAVRVEVAIPPAGNRVVRIDSVIAC